MGIDSISTESIVPNKFIKSMCFSFIVTSNELLSVLGMNIESPNTGFFRNIIGYRKSVYKINESPLISIKLPNGLEIIENTQLNFEG
jgi:hypothetical protein